jgi:hypothetical protein
MTRRITYFNELASSLFAIEDEQNRMIEDSAIAQSILGTATQFSGFDCTPNSPADLTVLVEGGTVFKMLETNTTAYGTAPTQLPIDTNLILKSGTTTDTTELTITPPGTPGNSRNDVVQISLVEIDGDPESVPFWNGVTNNVPNNPLFQTLNVLRETLPVISIKQGVSAPTGTQVTPAPDAGFAGAWVVTTANGQTTITSGDITEYPNAPFINILNEVNANALYAKLAAANTFTQAQTAPLFNGPAIDVVIPNATFNTGVADGNIVYYDSVNSRYDKALADGSVKQNVVGVADVGNGQVFTSGQPSIFTGLTANTPYYLSTTIAGAVTATPVTGSVVFLGISRTTTRIVLNISYPSILAGLLTVGSVYLSTGQSIPGGNVPTLIQFNSTEFDTGSLWQGTPDYFFKIVKAGYYNISGRMFFDGPGVSSVYLVLFQNGIEVKRLAEEWELVTMLLYTVLALYIAM